MSRKGRGKKYAHRSGSATIRKRASKTVWRDGNRIVSYLTEELIRQGHDVTLFASGDSETAARLIPVCHRSLRLDERSMDQLAHHVLLLEQVSQRAHEFDVIHFHIDYLHFPVSRLLRIPQVTTLHGRLISRTLLRFTKERYYGNTTQSE